jgi:diaminohydroxyphosphoribosylaminopyrimidine deaminase/5-amino-6-(5-phosphoribosylamino)uracil reductase
MSQRVDTTSARPAEAPLDADSVWPLLLAVAAASEELSHAGQPAAFARDASNQLTPVRVDDPDALLIWCAAGGWEPSTTIDADADARTLIDLYLPICSATRSHPIAVGHLGQSLDGFIATQAGDSRWVTGQENLRHMHRLRALCDAVVVGAGTVAIDDPQLTTRLVEGRSPLRVVIDPDRRLGEHHRLFTDAAAETLYVCAKSLIQPGERRYGSATIVGLDGDCDRVDVVELTRMLRARGCARLFVEGGGVTVSMFLAANLLDRLHVAIAPLLIGDGRPAIRLPARDLLEECHRPKYRVFRMGGDVLFDCDLSASSSDAADQPGGISRVI